MLCELPCLEYCENSVGIVWCCYELKYTGLCCHELKYAGLCCHELKYAVQYNTLALYCIVLYINQRTSIHDIINS